MTTRKNARASRIRPVSPKNHPITTTQKATAAMLDHRSSLPHSFPVSFRHSLGIALAIAVGAVSAVSALTAPSALAGGTGLGNSDGKILTGQAADSGSDFDISQTLKLTRRSCELTFNAPVEVSKSYRESYAYDVHIGGKRYKMTDVAAALTLFAEKAGMAVSCASVETIKPITPSTVEKIAFDTGTVGRGFESLEYYKTLVQFQAAQIGDQKVTMLDDSQLQAAQRRFETLQSLAGAAGKSTFTLAAAPGGKANPAVIGALAPMLAKDENYPSMRSESYEIGFEAAPQLDLTNPAKPALAATTGGAIVIAKAGLYRYDAKVTRIPVALTRKGQQVVAQLNAYLEAKGVQAKFARWMKPRTVLWHFIKRESYLRELNQFGAQVYPEIKASVRNSELGRAIYHAMLFAYANALQANMSEGGSLPYASDDESRNAVYRRLFSQLIGDVALSAASEEIFDKDGQFLGRVRDDLAVSVTRDSYRLGQLKQSIINGLKTVNRLVGRTVEVNSPQGCPAVVGTVKAISALQREFYEPFDRIATEPQFATHPSVVAVAKAQDELDEATVNGLKYNSKQTPEQFLNSTLPQWRELCRGQSATEIEAQLNEFRKAPLQ